MLSKDTQHEEVFLPINSQQRPIEQRLTNTFGHADLYFTAAEIKSLDTFSAGQVFARYTFSGYVQMVQRAPSLRSITSEEVPE